ncbi:MAG: TatD family hydrolase [Clostridiales bacterium]|jgi:TatD DNase family protein|nr:TatD family hydrolase [Eubacteriales bacterium]MDH7566097.1 TatD family hydrolase [Clostridiales bacterium]
MLFDTHAHYDDERFNTDRKETIQKAHDSGVGYIVNAASDMESAAHSIGLTREFHFIYAAVGIHPHNVGEADDSALAALADLAGDPKVVAVGEIGLDYYYDHAPREVQRYWFSRQIDLAVSLGLPVAVHDREAHEDTLSIIKKMNARAVGGVLHCYSGSVEMAKELLDNNFYISVGGPVTFKNAKKLVEVVKFVPGDRLLIETDCPYLTPEPHRGKRNDSSYVRLVAEKIAEIRGTTFEEIAALTLENAKRLFNIVDR